MSPRAFQWKEHWSTWCRFKENVQLQAVPGFQDLQRGLWRAPSTPPRAPCIMGLDSTFAVCFPVSRMLLSWPSALLGRWGTAMGGEVWPQDWSWAQETRGWRIRRILLSDWLHREEAGGPSQPRAEQIPVRWHRVENSPSTVQLQYGLRWSLGWLGTDYFFLIYIFFSFMVYHRILNIVPCAIEVGPCCLPILYKIVYIC